MSVAPRSPLASLSEPTPPALRRERTRLALLLAATLVWLQPWLGAERGPHAGGAPAFLGLVAAWGLALAALLARTRRGIGYGEAAAAAAVAGALALLLASAHPWIAGGERRASWIPIFAPLALLGLLDLSVRLRRPAATGDGEGLGGPGREITAIRGGSALLAAAALVVALEPLPAATAAFLGTVPFLVHWAGTARAARRALEAASLVAAVVLVAAPDLHAAGRPASFSAVAPTLWPYLWRVVTLGLAGVALLGVLSPEDRTAAVPFAAPAPRT
jgi:hypothetical protein